MWHIRRYSQYRLNMASDRMMTDKSNIEEGLEVIGHFLIEVHVMTFARRD